MALAVAVGTSGRPGRRRGGRCAWGNASQPSPPCPLSRPRERGRSCWAWGRGLATAGTAVGGGTAARGATRLLAGERWVVGRGWERIRRGRGNRATWSGAIQHLPRPPPSGGIRLGVECDHMFCSSMPRLRVSIRPDMRIPDRLDCLPDNGYSSGTARQVWRIVATICVPFGYEKRFSARHMSYPNDTNPSFSSVTNICIARVATTLKEASQVKSVMAVTSARSNVVNDCCTDLSAGSGFAG
ncbi:MAG: hypothetical protein QOF73_3757 [Thermomicrobiales bacterium]|nr:hypothetical protein [Thermomicrobiales bacterium]